MNKFSSEFFHDMYFGNEMHSALNQAITAISNKTFNLRYVLPLNSIFDR